MVNPSIRISDLPIYSPGKPIEELQRELGIQKVVKLASNENPLGPSKKVTERIRSIADQVSLYPDGDCFYLKKQTKCEILIIHIVNSLMHFVDFNVNSSFSR